MGFDKDDNRPVMDVHKRTTRVNLWLAVFVLIFLAIGGGWLAWVHAHPQRVIQQVDQKATAP